MPEMMVHGILINVERKNIKNVRLAVRPPMGHVSISAPVQLKDDAIRLFVISKLSWIKKHQLKFEQQQRQPERKYLPGESHYFQGQPYLLQVIDDTKNRVEIRNKKYLDLYTIHGSDHSKRKHILNKWYKQQLQHHIIDYISKWQAIIGVTISGYGIRLMKTKWGSCNVHKRHIWLNLELAKKPLYCLEYVVVHELIHLLERKHNHRFTAYMDQFMPQWRIYKNELNNFILDHAT